MVEWYHRLNGHEFEQTLGDGDGQEGLECCSPRGRKQSARNERHNNKLLHVLIDRLYFFLWKMPNSLPIFLLECLPLFS